MSRNAKRLRETVCIDEVMQVDSFEPDYESKCLNCGETPTVLGMKDGKVVYEPGMCGICTWGEADCIDPANW
ncbi:hypothetical protein [Burkholderia pseudomallei]|uniref:hypothetical protein n=1 Tax=Burkholderia pseudomallei TaxID=28450 RepID=UPI000A1A044A|nr:hypothetical protein [Burkholderia pseudomallei]ARK56276.1 hypothetical protein BOC36_24720 [Burkholderia pseudomallei]ARL25459.1 hypothetical protein BOC47_24100 [Burkholderia pseudomallei]ARL77571.1 hypothetical protein BOC54_36860 [Burkholderia pseudomallei]ARL84176.1 hypothetical protein BOC55_35185 [Burkholderia pseudomallei]